MPDSVKFSCPECGRQYKWRSELAGLKVKCKCGHIMKAPAEPPVDEAEDVAGLYALAEEEKRAASRMSADSGYRCPSCQQSMMPGAVMCTSCGFNMRSGARAAPQAAGVAAQTSGGMATVGTAPASTVLAYGAPLPRQFARDDMENAIGGSGARELYIPAALVLAGLAMQVVQNMYDGGSWRGLAAAMPYIGASMLFNLVLTFLGVLIVARLIEVSFGSPGPAVLKLVAICLLTPGIAGFVGSIVGADSFFVRMMVSALLLFPLAYFAFSYLFDFDFEDAAYCVVIVWIVNDWIVIFLLAMLFGGGMAFMGGGAGAATENQQIVEMLSSPNAVEAQEWLDESANRGFSDHNHAQSQRIVKDLYEAGATKVTAIKYGPEADVIIITLPRDREARKRIFDWEANLNRPWGVPPTADEGQRYLMVDF